MKTPFDLIRPDKMPEQKHMQKAADFIRRLFFRTAPIKPDGQKLVTIRHHATGEREKAWRMHWDITEDVIKGFSLYGGMSPNRNDIKYHRRYVADVYENGSAVDYIITPGQPSHTGRKGSIRPGKGIYAYDLHAFAPREHNQI